MPEYYGYGDEGYGDGPYGGYGAFSGSDPEGVVVLSRVQYTPPTYLWQIGPNTGTPVAELTNATSRSLSLHLAEPDEANYTDLDFNLTINGEEIHSNTARITQELITDLWVYRNGEPLFRGRVMGAEDSMTGGAHTISVKASDYRGVLDRRLIFTQKNYPVATNVATISKWLLDNAASSLGITTSSITAAQTIKTEIVTFDTGVSIWEGLKKLNDSDQVEIYIDTNKVAHFYNGNRGQDNNVTLDYGGLVVDAKRTFDSSQYATDIYQSGKGGATIAVGPTSGYGPEGRWDKAIGDPNLTTPAMIRKAADANLAKASGKTGDLLLPKYELTLAKGAWGGPSHVWLGDWVWVSVKSGRVNDLLKMRVHDMSIDIDENDTETVTISVGSPKVNLQSIFRGIGARLNRVERKDL